MLETVISVSEAEIYQKVNKLIALKPIWSSAESMSET